MARSSFTRGAGSIAPSPLKANRYELRKVGAHTRLVLFYDDGRPADQLFASRADAKAYGELAVNPPFVRFPTPPMNVNARMALDAHEAALAEFTAALDQELDEWQ